MQAVEFDVRNRILVLVRAILEENARSSLTLVSLFRWSISD